jgi:predicted ArsR family transcriptional regulator
MPQASTVDLWGQEPSESPSVRDSATSRRSAESAAPRAQTLRSLVLEQLQEAMTDDEGAERLGISQNTYRPRRVELVRRGDVVRVGTGRSAAGNPAAVWQARSVVRTDSGEVGIPASSWQAAMARPSWMSKKQHDRLLADALAANDGNLRLALQQVAADLEQLR